MYISNLIEEAIIGITLSNTDSKYGSNSHSWNAKDYAFGYQLDQWVVEKLFHHSDEVKIIELKLYVEDWENLNIKNKSQLSPSVFLDKFGSLALYNEDLEKIFIIDHRKLQFDKNNGWTLIGIYDKPDGSFSDHETFCIHDDIFDKIQSNHQDKYHVEVFIK